MCKLKSGIALLNRIYVAEHDSHSAMLEELGIKDDYLGASKKFVRWELSPADDDPFSDIDTWVLKVDQDIVPEWWSEEEYRPQIVEAVKEWAKTHIYIGVNDLKLNTGTNYYIKDCKDVEVWGSSSVEAWESSSVVAWGSSRVVARGSSRVVAWESSSVVAWGSSRVVARGSSRVVARGSSSVEAWGSSRVVAWESSRVVARGSSSVEAWGSSRVVAWESSSVVAWESASVKAWDSASVEACGSAVVFNSTVCTWRKQSSLILSENATFKDNVGKVIYQAGDFKLVSVESGKTIADVNV